MIVNDDPSLAIVICFLKVQNEWVVFKKNRFFPKRNDRLKTIEKWLEKRSFNNRFKKTINNPSSGIHKAVE